MTQVDSILSDQALREDLKSSIAKLTSAAGSIQKSVENIHQVVGDKEIRNDVKAMLVEARSSLGKVDEILSRPEVSGTLTQTKQAIARVDTVARQLNQIMNKRFPLVHLMFGRPGHVKTVDQETKDTKASSQSKADSRSLNEPSQTGVNVDSSSIEGEVR
ncbi:MAG: hypothetical protein K2Z81_15450 [Cyanobacteria bacterium]|nr:hypothetical protein [Cyanobacteriota bacterium]